MASLGASADSWLQLYINEEVRAMDSSVNHVHSRGVASGTIAVTNFRILFKSHAERAPSLSLPLGMVERLEKVWMGE